MTEMKPVYADVVKADARELLGALIDKLPSIYREAARAREYADLGGYDDPTVSIQDEISHLIGRLKRVHADLGDLRRHQHDWNSDDYCVYCGADGRS